MSEEKEKCCCNCGCEQTGNDVKAQEEAAKIQKRNLISAIILLILAALFAVWHFWGQNYLEECRYKSDLEDILNENGVEFTNVEVIDGKYVVAYPDGKTDNFIIVKDEDSGIDEFVPYEEPVKVPEILPAN